MAKGGGAGKVYFVLYLAVVLELLIIIVERDEAEEGLLQKQKETMRIVESILSQLQSGAGTEGINTRPQDEITIPPAGINIRDVMGADIKSFRKYIVEVGVTDIGADIKRNVEQGENEKDYLTRLKKLVQLSNVEEIEYQVFYNSSDDPFNAPVFPSDSALKRMDFMKVTPNEIIDVGSGWKFLSVRKLKFDLDETYNRIIDAEILKNINAEAILPIYPPSKIQTNGLSFVPKQLPEDSVFFYSDLETRLKASSTSSGLKKRAFVVNFEPPSQAGWYKLRFSSRTNRILGVRADQKPDQMDDETTINIGTVQLTVRDLQKVLKELVGRLEKFALPSLDVLIKDQDIDAFDQRLRESYELASHDENAGEMRSKVNLYGYIAKLLAPGQSINFDQNRGSIEFNIHVITPHVNIAEPTVALVKQLAGFDAIPYVFDFTISPYQSDAANVIEGRVLDINGQVSARIGFKPLDEIASLGLTRPLPGNKREYRATIDKALPPGQYTVEINHKLAQKSKIETSDLYIFKTGLTDESKLIIDGYFDNVSNYGSYLVINPIPNSGSKIKPDQFRIQFTTNAPGGNQNPQITGLNVIRDNNFIFPAAASSATVKILWKEPTEGNEVELYTKTVDIKQNQPRINVNEISKNVTSSEKKVKIRLKNIKITIPDADEKGTKADVKVGVNKSVTVNVQGFQLSVEPTIQKEEDAYTVSFELSGSLPADVEKIKGNVKLKINAIATNPLNGKTSALSEKDYNLQLNEEVQKEAPTNRGGGNAPGGRRR